jgi:hypothetical protein
MIERKGGISWGVANDKQSHRKTCKCGKRGIVMLKGLQTPKKTPKEQLLIYCKEMNTCYVIFSSFFQSILAFHKKFENTKKINSHVQYWKNNVSQCHNCKYIFTPQVCIGPLMQLIYFFVAILTFVSAFSIA